MHKYRYFYMDSYIKMPKHEKIELHLPEFYINNKRRTIPAILFEKGKHIGVGVWAPPILDYK